MVFVKQQTRNYISELRLIVEQLVTKSITFKNKAWEKPRRKINIFGTAINHSNLYLISPLINWFPIHFWSLWLVKNINCFPPSRCFRRAPQKSFFWIIDWANSSTDENFSRKLVESSKAFKVVAASAQQNDSAKWDNNFSSYLAGKTRKKRRKKLQKD